MRWQPAELVEARFETASARTLVLRVDNWPGHLPGQHVDVRLTAPDGYQAVRSYSLAAPAAGDLIELTVQRVPDGEVSGYLVDVLPVGARIEVRGPVGGWFVWNPDRGGAAVLIAGGSGIVPLTAMLRSRRNSVHTSAFRVIYSLRDPADLYYRSEWGDDPVHGRAYTGSDPEPVEDAAVRLFLAYTRSAPLGHPRPPGRLSAEEIAAHALPPSPEVTCYVCGPTGFVEFAAAALVSLGHDPAMIRTERFGPTGK
ncbi:ferredoxin reductase [Nocardia huaxiensis]|uniref:ferredoxin reductase n=1 Tax=Nocardia huaxiensis TaxID=2755382 RepID=UPI001E640988|nr:ferredoxin reductase [Nocardia huaxiensis]UFS99624.1 ferredoxin reductase [Nocardia huaxiensis]